jgi:hypothetical protein
MGGKFLRQSNNNSDRGTLIPYRQGMSGRAGLSADIVFRSVGRTTGTNKTNQHFIVSAANAIRTGDHANCRCRPGVTLRARWSGGAGRASRALRSWRSAFAGGPDRALATSSSLRTLRSDQQRARRKEKKRSGLAVCGR